MSDGLSLYERDFVRWSKEQAHALRSAAESQTNLPLDWDNLAEEIDSLGGSLRSEMRNRLATVLEHLLELSLSHAAGPRAGWVETILRERIEIEALIEENPSLRSSLRDSLQSAERKARRLAELSLRTHGEWSTEAGQSLATANFTDAQVLGNRLPHTEDRRSS